MKSREIIALIASVLLCESVGVLGSVFTMPSVRGWYLELSRPALTPPSWVFGPVWTLLFALMGIAAFLVWREGYKKRPVKAALNIFAFQLGLNFLWSVIFFSLHDLFLASVEILLLWAAILCTIIFFYRVVKNAAYLLVPYLTWVSFAVYLTFAYAFLN